VRGAVANPGFDFRDFGLMLTAVVTTASEDAFDAVNLMNQQVVEELLKNRMERNWYSACSH
jgi:hypothetical protein